jgi:MFS superfamily sulfate permease-like transporter
LVVGVDLLTGVLAGVALSLLKLLWKLVHFEADVQHRDDRVDVHLRGVLTFVGVPRLAAVLERLPRDRETHLHVDRVRLIDHAGLVTLRDYEARARARGTSVVVDWQHVDARCEGAAQPAR